MATEKRKIDRKQKVALGGLPQKIHILTEDDSLPVLLFLHGGPGVPSRHSLKKAHTDLLDTFTLVGWDQRGTGGSYKGVTEESMTVTQLTDDAAELVGWLCNEFKKDKIFIIGGSWGSMLGTFLAYRYPEKIAAYVGTGQLVDGSENERLSYAFAMEEAKKAGNEADVKALLELGAPVNGLYKGGLKGMLVQRKIMGKYGGFSPSEKKRNYVGSLAKPIILSGEYSIGDLYGILMGSRYILKVMWPEIGGIDLAKACPEFQMPYFIFDGRLDNNTPAALVEDYFEKIQAPRKELHWFEHSGHSAMGDEPEKFKKLLREKLTEVAAAEREQGTRI